jgi:hypothetical protein
MTPGGHSVSDKQLVIQAVGTLPETATWAEITDALIGVVARRGSAADLARLYREQLTAEHLAEYLNPKAEVLLDSVVGELEARTPTRESA